MRFHCPKCDAKYRITEEKLAEKPTAKMRCKDCSEIFSVHEAIAAQAQRATESPRSENEAQLLAGESPTIPPPRGPLAASRAHRSAPLAGGLGRGTPLAAPRPLGAGVNPLGQGATNPARPPGSRPLGSPLGAPTRPLGSNTPGPLGTSRAPGTSGGAAPPLAGRSPLASGRTLATGSSAPGTLPTRVAPSRLPSPGLPSPGLPSPGLGRPASVLADRAQPPAKSADDLTPAGVPRAAASEVAAAQVAAPQAAVPQVAVPQTGSTLGFGVGMSHAANAEADAESTAQSLDVSVLSLPPRPDFRGAVSGSSEDALTPKAPPIPSLAKTTAWDSFSATDAPNSERGHSLTVESEVLREAPTSPVELGYREPSTEPAPSKAAPEVFTASMDEYSPVSRRRGGSFFTATLAALLFGVGGFGAGYAVGVKQPGGAQPSAPGPALAVEAPRAVAPAPPPPPPPENEPASPEEETVTGAKSADARKRSGSASSKAGDDSVERSGAQPNMDSLGGLALGAGLGPTPGSGGPRSSTSSGVGLEASAIQSTVQKNQNAVKRSCWQPALTGRSADAPSSARITTTIQIAPSGSVSSVKHSGDPRGYPGLAACVATRVRGWTFPKSTATTTAEIPFVFAAQ